MNQRARPDREALFAALDLFVNCGDEMTDLQRFRLQHPQFFPVEFYDQSEQLAKAGKNNFFNWLKRQLRTVWEGKDSAGTRLAVLLGIRDVNYYGMPGGDFAAEVIEHATIFSDLADLTDAPGQDYTTLGAHMLFAAAITPDWQGSRLQYEPKIDFQEAVYALMNESWRARVCLTCRRYIIAAKPANIYCSTNCSGAARQKRDLKYWRSEGKALRTKRTKASKKIGRRGGS
ncbi:MAG: hypothetical protein ABSD76_11200 [Terriglobales bacterium]|jgi:hypothetical protein